MPESPTPAWTVAPATGYPLRALADLFTSGFAGYVIPMVITPEALAWRVSAEAIDLSASRVLLVGGEPAGLALIARRGRTSRLAAMGIDAGSRAKGGGRALLAHVLEDARARGDHRMRLEVFESNAPARGLYERAGFRHVARLVSYEAAAVQPQPAPLVEVDPADFAGHLAASEPGPLPWQLEPATLAVPPAGARCFTLEGKAFAYLASAGPATVALRGIVTLPAHRRQGYALRLLRALAAQFPAWPLSIPPLFPEGLGEPLLIAAGFRHGALTLRDMAIDLQAAAGSSFGLEQPGIPPLNADTRAD